MPPGTGVFLINTLSRGYSISMLKNNRVLSTTIEVKIGTLMTTQLRDGKIYSKVKKIVIFKSNWK
jgi:exodeoxyribonuclease VII large subunit